jgi:dTDP-4-dehydrorhamnose 3,5-epimerase
MIFIATELPGAFIVEQQRHIDARGFFTRSFCAREFAAQGLNSSVAQANLSYNALSGTLRGMHYQRAPHQEDKLVSCVAGAIWDAIIDLRPESPAFKRWIGVELSADNGRALFVPKGFAHGFITLTDHSTVSYLMSEFYAPGFDAGLRYDDPAIGIQWPLAPAVISDRDRALGFFSI